MSDPQVILNETDKKTIRVVEDLVDLLISKGLITMAELPQEVQDRLQLRSDQRAAYVAPPTPPTPPDV